MDLSSGIKCRRKNTKLILFVLVIPLLVVMLYVLLERPS